MLTSLWELGSLEILLACLIAALLVTVTVYLIVSGLFARINVDTCETKFGPMVVAYKSKTGPYKGAGEVFTDSYCLLPHREQIGIYYDDPETVAESELRYAVGPILSNGDATPDKEEMELVKSHGFKIFNVPRPNYVVTTSFPFRTILSLFIAIYRVYPSLRKYISQRNLCAYPAIEVYTDNLIVFLMPLSRQEEFFVPEFAEDDVSIATTDIGSVAGERDANVLKDEDLFLKPRTPVRINRPRLSKEGSNESSPDREEEEGDDPSKADDTDTASSYEELSVEGLRNES